MDSTALCMKQAAAIVYVAQIRCIRLPHMSPGQLTNEINLSFCKLFYKYSFHLNILIPFYLTPIYKIHRVYNYKREKMSICLYYCVLLYYCVIELGTKMVN